MRFYAFSLGFILVTESEFGTKISSKIDQNRSEIGKSVFVTIIMENLSVQYHVPVHFHLNFTWGRPQPLQGLGLVLVIELSPTAPKGDFLKSENSKEETMSCYLEYH